MSDGQNPQPPQQSPQPQNCSQCHNGPEVQEAVLDLRDFLKNPWKWDNLVPTDSLTRVLEALERHHAEQ